MPADDESVVPIEAPTGMHRYVMRGGPGDNIPVRPPAEYRTLWVHQMEWRVVDFTTSSNGVERFEWRDVPLVEEKIDTSDIPEVGEEFFAKARLSTPSDRLARTDTSLAKQLQKSMEKNAKLAEHNTGLSMRLEASIKVNKALNDRVMAMGRALQWIVNSPSAHPADMIKAAEAVLKCT